MHGGFFVEGADAAGGFVDQLIGDDQVTGFEFFTQRTDRAGGDDVGDPKLLEGVDVGAVGHGRGIDGVARAVAVEQEHLGAVDFGFDDGIAGLAEGGVEVVRLPLVSIQKCLPQSTTAD